MKVCQTILDGEMVVLVNGKSSFAAILKRDLKIDGTRIKLAVRKFPATFIAFDLLSLDNKDLIGEPLEYHLELLEKLQFPMIIFRSLKIFLME
nr:hypothetical protein [Anoxybacter fermentans]